MTLVYSPARCIVSLSPEIEGPSGAATNTSRTGTKLVVVITRSSRRNSGTNHATASERVYAGLRVSHAISTLTIASCRPDMQPDARVGQHDELDPESSSFHTLRPRGNKDEGKSTTVKTVIEPRAYAIILSRLFSPHRSASDARHVTLGMLDPILPGHHTPSLSYLSHYPNTSSSNTIRVIRKNVDDIHKQFSGVVKSVKQTSESIIHIRDNLHQFITNPVCDNVYRHLFKHEVDFSWQNPQKVDMLVRRQSRHHDYVALAQKFIVLHPECPIRTLEKLDKQSRSWRSRVASTVCGARRLHAPTSISSYASHAFNVLRYCFVTQLADEFGKICSAYDIRPAEIDLLLHNLHPMMWISFGTTGATLVIRPNRRSIVKTEAGQQWAYDSYQSGQSQMGISPSRDSGEANRESSDGWTPSFENAQHLVVQDGVFSDVQATETFLRNPQCPSGESLHPSMFSNAQYVIIQGGTFNNILNSYMHQMDNHRSPLRPESVPIHHDRLLSGRLSSAIPYAMLVWQAASSAMRPYHACLPLEINPEARAGLASIYSMLRFTELYHDMTFMMAPFTMWLFVKMWIQRGSTPRFRL